MAELKIKVVKIHEIKEHPNADKLELATIGGEGGYQCCVQKDTFKAGDKCVYFPVDSVLPRSLEDKIFGADAKVKLSKSRVKTIKLRGALSQGLAVPTDVIHFGVNYPFGTDLTQKLGVTKYEPSQKGSPTRGARQSTKKNINPDFHKYTNINHLREYPGVLEGKKVIVFEKIHGTNFRAGWVPSHPATWWERLKKMFGFFPDWQFVYGSHNVQLQGKYKNNDFYSKKTSVDVYTKMVKQYDLMNTLAKGEVLYAEIYGHGIQKNFTYGCKEDEHRMVVIDLKVLGKYISSQYLVDLCMYYNLDVPPIFYSGEFSALSMENLIQGPSHLCSSQKIREGIVVRTFEEEGGHMGRMVFKVLNPEYLLLKGNTEHH